MAMDALEKTGVTIREAGPGDTVAGVRPRWVALPESTEDVAAVLRVCAGHDLATVPVGGGTKLHWGRPPDRCDLLLDMCCLTGVTEHAAGDMVVRVRAGTTMETLAAELAAKGQELAVDVSAEGATVGGTLATGTAGPRRLRYGTPRDLLIGITVVLADGTVAHSGGKVVKNVAGYDLGKLFTGSHGTLGVITEAVFRLHPIPADRRYTTLTVPVPPDLDHLTAIVRGLAASQSEPSAIELDWPDPRGAATLVTLLEGRAAQERAAAVRGTVADTPPPWWGRPPADDHLLELRFPPAALAAVLAAASAPGVRIRGSVAAGVLWVAAPPAGFAAYLTDLRAALGRCGGRAVVLTAPPEQNVDRWGPVGALDLMRRVKERFDPGRRMSPGRFVGGI